MLDVLDGTTLARMSLSTAKAVRQEHRTPFARSLRHALRIFSQARNTLQIAPAGGPHKEAFVTTSRESYQAFPHHPGSSTVIGWMLQPAGTLQRVNKRRTGGSHRLARLVVFEGRSRQKARENTPETRRIRASKLDVGEEASQSLRAA